jgi:hypothetical protein
MTSGEYHAPPEPRVGSYRFYFADERWEWSPEVQRMHGYEPGTVIPTTQLVLNHKHPEDRLQVAATLDNIRRTREPFSTRHRIIDVHEAMHEVIVVGDKLHDDRGVVVGTHGFYVDVTPDEGFHQETINAAVAEIAESRSVIEQVKGMLMLIYRIDANRAFDLLRWRSQETNIRVRRLAEQLSTDFLTLTYDETLPQRSAYDQILLTAHRRIRDTR